MSDEIQDSCWLPPKGRESKDSSTRRRFLAQVAGGGFGFVAGMRAGPSLLGNSGSIEKEEGARFRKPTNPEEFKELLAGPIQSHPTPFNAKYELDLPSIRSVVRRGLQYGVRNFELTAGNSQYFALSYEEIKTLTKTFVESVAGEGIAIAATGPWWTERAVDYARYADSVGADAVQVLLPELNGGEDALVNHFESIARATRLPIVLHGRYSDSLLSKILKIDSIVAMKEDYTLQYYVDRIILFGKRLNIFSGGAENRYFVGYPYGAKAFFSTYTSFAPDISMKFWKAIQQKDLSKAVSITTTYDYPFIEQFTHSFWHATLEYFGVAKRYMRPPQETYNAAQMKQVKDFFDRQGLYPDSYRTSS